MARRRARSIPHAARPHHPRSSHFIGTEQAAFGIRPLDSEEEIEQEQRKNKTDIIDPNPSYSMDNRIEKLRNLVGDDKNPLKQ